MHRNPPGLRFSCSVSQTQRGSPPPGAMTSADRTGRVEANTHTHTHILIQASGRRGVGGVKRDVGSPLPANTQVSLLYKQVYIVFVMSKYVCEVVLRLNPLCRM